MLRIQCRLLASQSRYCVGLHELYLESTECPTADFEQIQEVCSSYVLSEFYASGSSGYLVISQAYVTSGKGFSPYGENKVYPEIQFQPQTQKNPHPQKATQNVCYWMQPHTLSCRGTVLRAVVSSNPCWYYTTDACCKQNLLVSPPD
jgi:hypothetical protein